ncbi:MAG: hypothetical protein ACREBJ_01325, partial [Nitrosotalea sp.]
MGGLSPSEPRERRENIMYSPPVEMVMMQRIREQILQGDIGQLGRQFEQWQTAHVITDPRSSSNYLPQLGHNNLVAYILQLPPLLARFKRIPKSSDALPMRNDKVLNYLEEGGDMASNQKTGQQGYSWEREAKIVSGKLGDDGTIVKAELPGQSLEGIPGKDVVLLTMNLVIRPKVATQAPRYIQFELA